MTSVMKALVAGILLLGLFTGVVEIGLAEEGPPQFPESHKDFLGGASYGALFGLNPNPVLPGPHSSDTGTGRPPRVGPNIQVNAPQSFFPFGLIGRSETTIAASGNGNFLVSGWNDADGFCGPPFLAPCTPPPVPGLSGYGWSADGGTTWVDGGVPFVFGTPAVMTRGDPSLAVGGKGNDKFYYANLGVFVGGPLGVTAGVTVHSGSFQANAFSWNNATLFQSPNFPNDFLDKEHIAARRRGNVDDVYVAVTNFIEVSGIPFFGFGQIEAYSSHDSAVTFGRAIVQPDETLSVPNNEGIVNQGPMPAVGPDGIVYVTWERGWLFPLPGLGAQAPQIVVASSSNGGATWTPRIVVSDICSGALFPPGGYNRGTTNDFPRIAVAQSGPNRGRLYVAYQDCRIANAGPQSSTGGFGHWDTDIYVAYSDDQSATWTTQLVAGGGDGKIQFWPTVSVQPGGNVDVTYYESVETATPGFLGSGPGTSLVDVFWSQSINGGASWESPVRVTEVTTNWGATATNIIPNFGDYNTAVSAGNRLFATWADGRNGVPDTFFAKILTIGKAPR